MAKKPSRRKKEPTVIEHAPAAAPLSLFKVVIQYESGAVTEYDNVTGTVTQHSPTPQEPAPPVPYRDYMIIQRTNRDSIYVNMERVEELKIGVQE